MDAPSMQPIIAPTLSSVPSITAEVQPVNQPTTCSIHRLPKDVVDRIAAGEVIQRPVNAVKELLENCLDAGSTHIEITVRSGGLKMLQVQDNGCGINVADLPLLCERFTTSKLKDFEDLNKLTTFGFRGEALASLSHVSLLTVTSRTADEPCAYRMSYRNGKPTDKATACAGNQGTTILAEDLFYNTPLRRAALNNPRDEFSRITEVVSQYAVHYAPKCGFHLRSLTAGPNLGGSDLRTTAGWSRMDAVRATVGPTVAQNMISFDSSHSGGSEATRFAIDRLGLRFEGLLTAPNQISSVSNPSLKLHLFINNRLVECTPIKRALESSYSTVLSRSLSTNLAVRSTSRNISTTGRTAVRTVQTSSILLAYLNLQLPTESLDVNVHPTKAEVRFLHEDQIIAGLQDAVEHCLLSCSQFRSFLTRSLPLSESDTKRKWDAPPQRIPGANPSPSFKPQEKIRIDAREQCLERFVHRSPNTPLGLGKQSSPTVDSLVHSNASVGAGDNEAPIHQPSPIQLKSIQHTFDSESESCLTASPILKPGSHPNSPTCQTDFLQPSLTLSHTVPSSDSVYPPKLKRRTVRLDSVLKMQQCIKEKADREARKLLRSSKFVGLVDRTRCLVQHSTDLLLVRLYPISKALFYQLLVFNFANHGEMVLSQSAPIVELLKLAQNSTRDNDESHVNATALGLLEHAAMLWDYFSIKIEPGKGNSGPLLTTLPLLLDKYVPDLDYLPVLISQLTTEVNWEEELPCFEDVCRVLSEFYAVKPPMKPFLTDDGFRYKDTDGDCDDSSPSSWRWIVEHVLWFAISRSFYPESNLFYEAPSSGHSLDFTKVCSSTCAVFRLTRLSELYKVFERC